MKTQAFNPYLPSYEYVPDGEPRVFGDRLYIFGSHDAFGGDGYCPNDYVCWSAPVDDPGAWQFESVIYRKTDDPQNSDGAMKLFAPDVVHGPDGRYYLYYVLHASPRISCAVCSSPAGHYRFLGFVSYPDGTPVGTLPGDPKSFDPGVLVDDGLVYLYTGFAPGPGSLRDLLSREGTALDGAWCLPLEADMLTLRSDPVRVLPGVDAAAGTEFEGHAFFEASSPRRIGSRYYFVYSSIQSHELCYAVSAFPDRGFRYGGTLISIGDLGLRGNREAMNYTGNTHGGLVRLRDQWYIFYHRQTNQQGCARQGCAEPVYPAPDGSIPQAELTSCGLNRGPLAGTGSYEARIACCLGCREPAYAYVAPREPHPSHPYFTQSGSDREDSPDQYIANMRSGAWCMFRYFRFSGQTRITLKVRGSGAGSILISHDRSGPVIGQIPIRAGSCWALFSGGFSPKTGTLPLCFTYQGTNAVDLDSFTIE